MLVASLLASSAVLLLGSVDKAEAASVDSISPTSGTALGGDTLTISGSGFKSDLGDYVALPYIQFYKDTSNSMYPLIDTGVQLNAATEVTVTYMVTGYNQQNVWGAKGDTTEIALVSGDASSNSGAAFQSFINGSTTLVTQFASIAQSSGILKVTAGNGSVSASLLTPASDPTTGWVQSGSHTFKPVGDDANIIVGSRQTGYFTGRIYSFSIVNGTVGGDTTVSFNGVPAYGPYTNPDTHVTSNQYGLYDTVSNRFFANTKGGNELIEGQIWGPSGSGGAAPTPPTINVSFSGMAGGSSVSKPCQSLTIVSTTQATCTVPASMLDGDGSGVANVTVTVTDASGPTVGTFNYTYENDKPALLSVAPEKGPMTGGS
ncbi:MAG: IPT/TIG domain-containing protein, partial [Propionibacteriaceae bacterium]|nr:IPT/TIG domain-containing protein [Propionibacteriaceae bacterium]